jgi:cell wall-associated NlpC family hydrolase
MSEIALDYSDLLGIPWGKGGRGPGEYDCYGLAREALRRVGVEIPERMLLWSEDKETGLRERNDAINIGKEDYEALDLPEPYCIVTFILHPPYVTHIGVILPNRYQFIHIMRKRRVAVERLDNPYWQRRIEGYYRYVANATRNG